MSFIQNHLPGQRVCHDQKNYQHESKAEKHAADFNTSIRRFNGAAECALSSEPSAIRRERRKSFSFIIPLVSRLTAAVSRVSLST
jgi:hypothetical protein